MQAIVNSGIERIVGNAGMGNVLAGCPVEALGAQFAVLQFDAKRLGLLRQDGMNGRLRNLGIRLLGSDSILSATLASTSGL